MARMVSVQWIKGMKAEAVVGPHRIVLDAPAEAGGGDEGPSPAEMLLRGHGGLTLLYVWRFAGRQQWPFHRLDARLAATEAQGRITGIDAEVILDGAFDEDQVAKLR